MGDRADNLQKAIADIDALPCTSVEAVSSVMETEPQGEWEASGEGIAEKGSVGRGVTEGIRCGESMEVNEEVKTKKFLNCCVRISTSLQPRELLRRVKEIETAMGRAQRPIKKNEEGQRIYSDRPIDIDILLYGSCRVNEPDLQIPHPRMLEREFVLRPLKEIL